jgi:glutamyl endopeptidase
MGFLFINPMCKDDKNVFEETSNVDLSSGYSFKPRKFMSDFQEDHLIHISSKVRGMQARLVCERDDRVPVDSEDAPFKGICKLIIIDKKGNGYLGTGFFISPTCVATSGHCVFNDGEWMDEIIVIPGSKGKNSAPFGKATSTVFKSVKGWTEKRRRDFDYGAVILNDASLYAAINYKFNLKTLNGKPTLLNSGYPSDKGGEQWLCTGDVKEQTLFRIYYMIDTEKGNSGSPVIINDDTLVSVVGIHSYGECPNFCIAINEEILSCMTRWSKIDLTQNNPI